MKIKTAWVKPPQAISGQDHLGTQAPSESIYTSLLPGITNVTGRARYYSFYPWLLWSFQERFPGGTAEELQMTLRRAECLFALIGARHGMLFGEAEGAHGRGMVGWEVLHPALQRLPPGQQLALSTYARLDESNHRYFKNPLGGLGQYYFGPLRDIGILGGDTRTKDLRYTPERGLPLARALSLVGLDDAFFTLLEADAIGIDDLDALAALCPCGLRENEKERSELLDILVDPGGRLGDESRPRRLTLSLLLDLAARSPRSPDTAFDHEFRAAAYAGTLPDGRLWDVPETMAPQRAAWATYQRNELLSVAIEGLFWAALYAALDKNHTRFASAAELAGFFLSSAVRRAVPDAALAASFAAAIQGARSSLPPLGEWEAAEHEVQAAWRLFEGVRANEPHAAARASLDILLALAARDTGGEPYAACAFDEGYFERYPINLRTFLRRAQRDWAPLSLEEVIRRLLCWAIETHYRVALQKLAASPPRDTFKVRPMEGGIRVVDAPPPTFTAPRIHRAEGMLRDLGLMVGDADGNPTLTPVGEKLLGGLRA